MMRIETPASRPTDPHTSAIAERSMTESGARQAQILIAAKAVREHPGVNSSELARLTELDRHMLGRRLSEAETAGLVERGDPRTDPVTGRPGVTWWPKGVA
ncbi:helix-turn-helix domain-containing protein [Thioalkalivibrio sp. ARh3]|uniref:MarR family transcriptional regulator n=1 Tax=Thioalkalivibrio sp. ARh3 TaxID=1158148 RepID=UPI000376133C|nr:helix-turn-helix domain-containing protein [Thioalkalivibrio sp. ARh3]